MFLGERQIDDTLTFTVTTHTFSTGALTDATGDPAYRVYEDETGTAILTGSMAKLDDANTTGHYSEQITLSAANGFEEGKSYSIYITATVSSVTGGTVRSFQVEAAKATAAALATVDGIVDDILVDTGTTLDALIKDVPTVAEFEARTLVAANYFDPATDTVANVTTVGSVTGAVGSVTGAVGSVTGAVGSVTGNVGGNVAGSVGSVTGAVGSVTGNVGGNVTGSVGSVAAGGITAASIATNAIDADALAADAVTEIQSGLATATNLATLAGYVDTEVAAILAAVDTEVAAIKAKTDNLPASPAAVGSAMTLSNGAITAAVIATDAIDNDAIAANAVTEIQSGLATAASLATVAGYIDTEVASILAAVDTEVAAIKAKTDNLPAAPAATGDIPTAAANADAVWDEILAGHVAAGSTGEALGAAGSAGDPWVTALPGAYGAGSAGKILGDNLNATISSRATQTSVDALPTSASLASLAEIADGVWDETLVDHQTTGSTGKALDTAATNTGTTAQGVWEYATRSLTDKAGFALTAAYDAAKTAATQASITALNNLSSAEAQSAAAAALTAYDAVVPADLASLSTLTAQGVWEYATRSLTDKAGFALSAGGVTAVQTGLATAAALTAVSEFIDTEVAAILAAVDTEVAAIKAKTDNLPADPADQSAVEAAITAAITTPQEVWEYGTRTLTSAGSGGATAQEVWEYATRSLTDKINFALTSAYDAAMTAATQASVNALPDASTIVDMVWDEQVSGHVVAGSTGATLLVGGSGTPADAEAIAEAVWENDVRTLTSAGAGGATAQEVWEYATRTLTEGAGTPVDAAAIADAVWDEPLSGHVLAGSAGLKLGLIAGGVGATTVEYVLTDTETGDPIELADVWVLDGDGDVVASGVTDVTGTVTFYLDAGAYNVYRQKAGYDFVNPQAITIS